MRAVEMFNLGILLLFLLCYAYQFFYIPVVLLDRPRPRPTAPLRRYAVLIAARNERAVIGQLIDSLRAQNYPPELLDIYVAADNCTDDTAAQARLHGARVYERFDLSRVGKGYALDFLLRSVERERGPVYAGYFVFDADNVLDPDFVREMNQSLQGDIGVVTSYRNSKNYGDNWISAGYALWFLRDSRYLNQARMRLGGCCAVAGTGFLISARALRRCGGWHYFLLTEDTEFTVDSLLRGVRIGYCPRAVLYDEQPTDFSQSWRQRKRWCRGYLQVFRRYGGRLLRGIFSKNALSCFDMTMSTMPAAVLTGLSAAVNLCAVLLEFFSGRDLSALALSVLRLAGNLYLTLFFIGALTTCTEWRQIHAPARKKLLYMFTFPVFMFSYVPVCFASLFGEVRWQPIRHERSLSLDQIRSGSGKTA